MESTTWEVTMIRWRNAWEQAGRAPSTVDTYITEVWKFAHWGKDEGRDTSSLQTAELYIDHVRRSRGQHMARQAARGIKAFGKFWAVDFEEADPYVRLRLPKEPEPTSKHAKMATEDDLAKLLASCDRRTFIGDRDFAIITLLAGTGLRRGEVAGLRLDDVDLVRQTIYVAKGKNAAARRSIHMPEPVQAALVRYLRKREVIVAKRGALADRATALFITEVLSKPNLTANGLTQMLRKKGLATGVDVRAHAFRRWHASRWLAAGGSETGLMANEGWTSSAMVARYTRDAREQNAQLEAERLFG